MNPSNSSTVRLFEAIANQNAHGITLSLEAGSDPNSNNGHWSAIALVAAGGHRFCLEHLLQANPDVNARMASGETAAMVACTHGHFESLGLLIAAGADIDARDHKGHSAGFCALNGPNIKECLAMLLAAGCDLDAEASPGESLGQLAARHADGRYKKMIQTERIRREVEVLSKTAKPGPRSCREKLRI